MHKIQTFSNQKTFSNCLELFLVCLKLNSFWFLKNARAKLNQQQGLDINRVPKCVQHLLKICISQKCFTNFAKIQVKFQNLDFFSSHSKPRICEARLPKGPVAHESVL
jgi:hypothetical protein